MGFAFKGGTAGLGRVGFAGVLVGFSCKLLRPLRTCVGGGYASTYSASSCT